MVDQETNSLLVLYDDAQSINAPQKRRAFSFSQVGIQARGRTTILRLNYRNTSEVMAVACEFAREVLTPKEAEEDAIPLVAPETAGRRGPPPILLQFPNEERELAHIVERARELNKAGSLWSDMAVVFRYNNQGERVAAALGMAGIPIEWFGRHRSAGGAEPSNDSVKLLTMHSSKGLEFPIVFIPCLDSMPNARLDAASEAKLLYVAMTRAMDRLIMTHRTRSAFVDRVEEALKHAA
jgi:superfamily I DNA/RNA helicase